MERKNKNKNKNKNNGFQLAIILRRKILTRMNYEIDGFRLV
jgi:hypothetical protein